MSGWGTTAAGAGSGALTGAAAGSVIPGFGTAAGAVAGGLVGLLGGLSAGDGGASQQRALANANLQNSQNQQQYTHALNAEALRRAIAGSTDAQGSSVRYDPGSNSWVSTLGSTPTAVQNAETQSNILRNRVDIPQASANNIAQAIQASMARRGMSGAINNLNSFTPISAAGEAGALQDASTRANQVSQEPVIADTLRSLARSGTAAGPVLAQLERANADTLAQEMDRNVVQSQTDAAQVNNANQSRLASQVSGIQSAGTPATDYPGMTGNNPSAQLAALVNGRATGSATPASQGAYSTAFGTQANTGATAQAIGQAGNNPLQGFITSGEKSLESLFGKKGSTDPNADPSSNLGSTIAGWYNNSKFNPNSSASAGSSDYNYNPSAAGFSAGSGTSDPGNATLQGLGFFNPLSGGSPIGIPNNPNQFSPGNATWG